MSAWLERTIEERNLLNPAFCAVVLWHLAKGYQAEGATLGEGEPGLPIELAFVGASFVLRGQTRRQLPRDTRTSLANWIHDHPLERSAVAKGVIVLRPYVREAVIFGSQQGAIALAGASLTANASVSRRIAVYLKQSSDEVRDCAHRAQLVGRWLHKGGTPSTVMTLVGVQA
jgi:hypothetical protein